MKTFLRYLIAPIIVGVLIMIFQQQQQKPKVVYFLSEGIPMIQGNTDATKENLQIIEVKNLSNSKAENITVKIDKQEMNYSLEKNSLADKVEIFETGSHFELVYSILPVEGAFRLAIQTDNVPLDDSLLEIKHSDGLGINALDKKELNLVNILPILVIFIYLLLTIRVALIQSLENNVKYNEELKVLQKIKPFYLSESKWIKIRSSALKNYIKSHDYILMNKDIEDLHGYKLLEHEAPGFLTKNEWREAIKLSVQSITESIDSQISRTHQKGDLLEILIVKRPKYFPQNDWDKMMISICKNYVMRHKEEIYFYNLDELVKLDNSEPEGFKGNIWSEYLTDYKKIVYQNLLDLIHSSKKPLDELKKYNLGILTDFQKGVVESSVKNMMINLTPILYDKENAVHFLETPNIDDYGYDYHKLREIAEKTIDLDSNIEKYETLKELLNKVLYNKEIPEMKPESLSERTFGEVKSIYFKIKELDGVKEMKREIVPLKEKITKQLIIINDALTDASALDRIEEYNNVFAKGNYTNLKKIAELKVKLDN